MKDFLAIADFSTDEINELLELAVELKNEWKSGGNLGAVSTLFGLGLARLAWAESTFISIPVCTGAITASCLKCRR